MTHIPESDIDHLTGSVGDYRRRAERAEAQLADTRHQLDVALRRAADLQRRIDTARDLIDQAVPDLHDRARRWLNRIDHALRGGTS